MSDTSASTPKPILLTELAVGAAARLHSLDLCDEDCALLRALGMSPSCQFRLCKVGEPWIVQVRETRIGLASPVASRLYVVPEAVC